MEKLIKLNDLPNMQRTQVRENFKTHMNPGLCTLFGLLDFDKLYVKAEGTYVWDADGNRYLDFLGGYGSLNLGHNHPRIIAALNEVSSMPNLLQASMGMAASALAHNLAQLAPGKLNNTFFCNSGAEAVEGAIKLARIATGRQRILSCKSGFHGKTLGSLSVTGREKYHKGFEPLLPSCNVVDFCELEELEEALKTKDVAAFIVEPIQGEGGIIVPPQGYLKAAQDLCRKYGTLFVADEIQTGLGRTGTMFASEREGIEPDILCLAKSLGGGIMPIGAVMTTTEIWNKAYGGIEKCLLHTSTFGGNTWAATAGLATLEVLHEENLVARSAELGDYLINGLRTLQEKYPIIRDVRGRGLLVGIEFEQPASGVLSKVAGAVNKLSAEYLGAMVAGVLLNKYRVITAYTLNNPNVVRLEPPLVVTEEQIDVVLNALEETFEKNRSLLGFGLSSGKTMLSGMFGRRK
ncbi:aspartate aminotransferase family protein [Dethiobacter alkaliphilus]|uniref:aspartate aminotransferase family protein n=1 Tax=Dethiobacter alkaliphilus TaxID=427926 RepID=UPI002226BB42|nr:aspartate aminotransferase family protein [Dethiobacter alkaliphilus]MCW3490099.1 aspartate aminotransferase family protein [Dethiobacter alkaliphilus]